MNSTEISVIIPVYNDPEGLRDTLGSLVDQNFEEDYEILPVDNNSTDNTRKVIDEFERSYPNLVRGLEENDIQSSYAARNTGIEESQGDILCFIDADMWVEDDWLDKIEAYFENNPKVEYIGTNVELVNNSSTSAGYYNELNGFPINKYIEELNFAPTCCLSVRKSVFDRVGVFNDSLISGGDREFGIRASEKGIKTRFLDDLTVYHPARTSWKSLRDKSFRIGRGAFQKQVNCPELFPDQRTPLYDIRSLLPTTPGRLANNIGEWKQLTLPDKISFYFIYWSKKVWSYLGYQYERFVAQHYIRHP